MLKQKNLRTKRNKKIKMEEDEKICECGHEKKYHNLGSKKLISGCNHIVDDDGESYGLCECKKFKQTKK